MLFSIHVITSILFVPVFFNVSINKSSAINEFVGESMHYDLKYSIFHIGIASISCFKDQVECGDIIKAEAQSTGLLKIFRNLNYRFECCMDPVTGLPNSAIMDLKDGNTISYSKVRFDHYSRTDSAIVISQTTGEHIVPKNIHDLLTGYYHFRKNYLAESIIDGQPVVIQTYLVEMLWDLRMTYTGEETINTMYGQVNCSKFTSSTVVGSFFKNDDDMTVWFTKDEIPVPIRIRLNFKIGSIKGELYKYQTPIHN